MANCTSVTCVAGPLCRVLTTRATSSRTRLKKKDNRNATCVPGSCCQGVDSKIIVNASKPKRSPPKCGKFLSEHCSKVFTYSQWLETHVTEQLLSLSAENGAYNSTKPTIGRRKAGAAKVSPAPLRNLWRVSVLSIQCFD